MMEAAEEEVILMGSKEQTLIAKGKRTKRQRPQSPSPQFPTTTTTNSSTVDGGGSVGDPANIINNTNYSPSSSPASTEEEEDMANCLILLAQGQSRSGVADREGIINNNNNNNYKHNSRRFLETGKGASGCYVYECKTCNRTFPSFQALGGHRASHKKPKPALAADHQEKKLSDDEEFKNSNNVSSALSLQLKSLYANNGNNQNSSNNKSKVHECSICGAEFNSGQALGGHMRRHRASIGTNTALSLTPMAVVEHVDHHHHNQQRQNQEKTRNVLCLDLDLNLPAPEDDHREHKFSFVKQQQQKQQQQQQQQQSSLVFSAPALVDCHY